MYSLGTKSPFELFSILAWEEILNSTAKLDSSTAYNILLAYSELNTAFHKKKKQWLFGKALPLLFEHISGLIGTIDLLALRGVCQHWKSGVHDYLINQPGLQPFIPGVHDEAFSIRQEMQTGWRALIHEFSSRRFFRRRPNQKDLKWLGSCGRQGLSPELYHTVSIKLHIVTLFYATRVTDFFTHILDFLCHTGLFVRSLILDVPLATMSFLDPRLLPTMDQEWNQIFSLLPNLRELIIRNYFPFGARAITRCTNFPSGIQALELKTREQDPSLSRVAQGIFSMVDVYSLRSVRLTLNNLRLGGFPTQREFSQLTQLDLHRVFPNDALFVKQLLRSGLNAPNLTSLSLSMVRARLRWGKETFFSVEQDMFCWLERFKFLRSLEITSERGMSCPIRNTEATKAISVHEPQSLPFILSFLSIKNNNTLSYEFLRRLPNLKCLYILIEEEKQQDEEEQKEDQKEECRSRSLGGGSSPTCCLGQQFRTSSFYEYGIWEVAGKLSRVIIDKEVGQMDIVQTVFSRYNYELLKKGKK